MDKREFLKMTYPVIKMEYIKSMEINLNLQKLQIGGLNMKFKSPSKGKLHKKTRHIQQRFNYIRNIVEDGDVCIRKVNIDQIVMGPFTKPLSPANHEHHVRGTTFRYSS